MKTLLATFCLCLLTVAAFAQSDRGSITGTVVDPAQAVVPAAKVVATDAATKGVYETQTTATGNYTLALLPEGIYDLSVSAAGFRESVRTGIPVHVAQVARMDVVLVVGSTMESVTVTGELPLLRTENAEQSIYFDNNHMLALPINYGGGNGNIGAVRDPLSFIVLSPGVSGTSLQAVDFVERANVNGQPGGAFKIYFEGQDSTSNNTSYWGTIATQGSVDAIGEFAMQTSNFAAEYGNVLGAVFNFTAKSGTNQLHGGAFEYFANEDMDAGNPWHFAKPMDRKNDFGGSFGGPVYIPKVYDGRNKMFFFFNVEIYRNVMATTGLNTVPTQAYRTGNFSAALTGKLLTNTLDPLGRQIYENVVYDPATVRTVNGQSVTDPFPGNIVPTSRLDPVALKMQAYIPPPVNSNLINNWVQYEPNHMWQSLPSGKFDYYFSPSSKISFYQSEESTNKVTATSMDGLPVPITHVSANPGVYSYTTRVNFDHTFTPNLVANVGAGFLRFDNPAGSLPGVINFNAQSLLGFQGATITPGGFPSISGLMSTDAGGMLSMGSAGWNSWYDTNITAVASVSYIHGNHTYKMGATFKQPMYAALAETGNSGSVGFSANQTALPSTNGMALSGGTTGFPYASFLLGLGNSGSIAPPSEIGWRTHQWAMYLQDSWKITRRLTLSYGLRWQYFTQGHEEYNRNSEFSETVLNPSAGNLPGGLVYEGNGPGRCNCSFTHAYPYAVGPRLGLAYQINPKTVFRAGWGVIYSEAPQWNTLTVGQGTGYNTISLASPAFGQPAVILQQGLIYNPANLYSASLNPGLYPTAGSLAASLTYFDPNGGRPARVQEWNIALQRELAPNLSVEAAYVGNRGAWLEADSLEVLNATQPSSLAADGFNITSATARSVLTSTVGSTLAAANGIKLPYAGYPTTTTVAQSLRPFPQFSSSPSVKWAPLGDSWYDSLQTKLIKRSSYGLDAQAAFTWEKELALGPFSGGSPGAGGAAINNPFNFANNKTLSANSQPWNVTGGFTYTIPAFTQNNLVRRAVHNWVLGGMLRYSAGQVIPVPTSNNALSSLLFVSTFQNRVPGVPLFLENPNCHCIDANKNLVLNPAAWTDAPAGTFGTSAGFYNDYRWQRLASETLSLGRTLRIREKMSLQLRAEFFNVFNRVNLPLPTSSNPAATSTYNPAGAVASGFGFVNVAGSVYTTPMQRNGQLVARFSF